MMKSRFLAIFAGLVVGFGIHCDGIPANAFVQEPETNSNEESTASSADPLSVWNVDNSHSSVIFAVSHSGLSYIYGRFNSMSGSVTIDSKRPESSKFSFRVDPKSIDTNDEERDRRLTSAEFLDVSQFESISFSSTDVKLKVEPQSGRDPKRTFIVGGNLTLHGETRRIVVPIELLAAGKGKDGRFRCGFMSKFVVRRSSHGIDALPKEIGDSVAVTLSFQAIQELADSSGEEESPTEEGDEPTMEKSAIVPVKQDPLDIEAKRKRVEQLSR